jgi:hypothetical protein
LQKWAHTPPDPAKAAASKQAILAKIHDLENDKDSRRFMPSPISRSSDRMKAHSLHDQIGMAKCQLWWRRAQVGQRLSLLPPRAQAGCYAVLKLFFFASN